MTIDKLNAGDRFKLPLSGKTGAVIERGLNTGVQYDNELLLVDGLYVRKINKVGIISSKTEVEKL